VLRIPLIVHLPPSMRHAVATDLERVSFSTDLTPTLYALLGIEPAALGPLFGAPLFAAPDRELSSRRHAAFMEASSYGPVYGMLRQNGRHLYIADAVNGKEYAYDLFQEVSGRRVAVTDADRTLSRGLIRDQITALATLFHFDPRP
jgi:arylsulfatase A-like enzyme